MTPETRGRSRSRSDASMLSKSSGGRSKPRRGKRDRAESGGDVSVLSTASTTEAKAVEDEKMEVEEKEKKEENKTEMDAENEKPTPKKPKKLPPTIDTIVHRMRHLNYLPKPILTMKSTNAWSKHSLVAISRENGCIEVKSLDEKLRTLVVLPGKKEHPVHLLAWIKDSQDSSTPMLVGATRRGGIFMINFAKQTFSGVTASGGGGVYALESLSSIPGCERLVAAGCQDGSIRFFQYHENGSFILVSSIPSSGAPVDSLAWSKRNITKKGLDGLIIFAGIADGTIRRFDCSEKNERTAWKSVTRMTVESRGRNIPTRVWALQALNDGTLVSGNSLGQVQFWDGETGALEQSIEQTDTKADVLDLAISSDEAKVFASGIDARVICIERQLGTENSVWMLTHAQRPHTHDVKSVEIACKKTKHKDSEGNLVSTDILITGGTDIKICTYNVTEYHTGRPRTIYPWPTVSPVFIAGKARMIGVMREEKVDLYRVTGKRERENISNPVSVNETDTLVGTVEIHHGSNLTCATMSDDGRYLAVADSKSVYLFVISFKKERLQTKQLKMEKDVKSPVSAMKFSNDTTLIASCVDGSTLVVSLEDGKISGNNAQRVSGSKTESNEFPVHSIVTCPSGTLFATQRNTLQGGVVETYSIGKEGTVRHLWTLPSLDSPIADVSFLDENRIAVGSIDFELVIFDIKEQRLNQWNVGTGSDQSLPPDLKKRRDHPVRVFPAVGNPNQVFLVSCKSCVSQGRYSGSLCPFACWVVILAKGSDPLFAHWGDASRLHWYRQRKHGGSGAFVVFQIDQPFPTSCRYFPEDHVRSKREAKRIKSIPRKLREESESGSTAKICYQYNSMVYLGFLSDAEMVVVEEPWINVWNTLPAALSRRVYGS
eukprot:scaffold638_cov168-Amphora_coffeaeformis.AAC.40